MADNKSEIKFELKKLRDLLHVFVIPSKYDLGTKPLQGNRKDAGIMEKIKYIAYGSNLNLDQMAYRCPTAKVIGNANLNGYELLFRGGNGGAVATVEKNTDSSIPVLVWELEPSDEVALDRYEGWPHFYRKEWVKVEMGMQWVKVMVYIMNDGRQIGSPSKQYYNTILQGYTSAGFDKTILDNAVKKSTESVL